MEMSKRPSLVLACAFMLAQQGLHAQQYVAVILPRPATFAYAYGEGAGTGFQVGHGIPAGHDYYDVRALRWIDGQGPQDITPPGFNAARVEDAEGDQIVGSSSRYSGGFGPLATVWLNGGGTPVILHPPEFNTSEALGVGGGQQAGYVLFGFFCSECGRYIQEHAALWSGSAESAVRLHAPGFDTSRAQDTDGTQQVGYGFANSATLPPYQALLWHGPGSTPVNLHPGPGFDYSFATSVADGQQGGYGWGPATDDYGHALLWRGSAQSVVDLNPAGFYTSTVTAVRGGVQVGFGGRFDEYHNFALAWRGTPESVINLHALLPEGYRLGDSLANDINENGDIVGTATEDATGQTVAVLWRLSAGPIATSLSLEKAAGPPGQAVTLRATLTRAVGGGGIAGRSIAFKVDGSAVGAAITNSTGTALLAYTIPPGSAGGSRPTNASFAGDASSSACSASSSLTVVVKAGTSLSVGNVSGRRGQTVTLNAALTAGGSPVVGRTLSFRVNGASVGFAATNSSGVARLSSRIPANAATGIRSISAAFSGDASYSSATGFGTLTVSR
jgi:hypothetical protein